LTKYCSSYYIKQKVEKKFCFLKIPARFLCRTVFRPGCNNDGEKRNWYLNYNDKIGQIHGQNQG
jgi:hypothetical protein